MKKNPYVFVFSLIALTLLVSPMLSAVHYITGQVNDSYDGEPANNHTAFLWNPSVGMQDNLTDIIGPEGNSGEDNNYEIDCDLLDNGCQEGDNLSVKVIDTGDGYITDNVSVTVSSTSPDAAPDLRLNSFPNVTLNNPKDTHNSSMDSVEFNCSAQDPDGNLENLSLYGNWSGGWHVNETKSISGSYTSQTFTKYLEEGIYQWNCKATDDLSVSSFNEKNYTLTIDKNSPKINNISVNSSYTCGNETIRVSCNVTDNFGINKTIIQSSINGKFENYTTQKSGDIYYSDIEVNRTGTWTFKCISEDFAGNTNSSNMSFEAHPNESDLLVHEIFFSKTTAIENEPITINATILNNGCTGTNNFPTGFYENNITSENQIDNKTTSLQALSNTTLSITWNAKIGPTNIFVYADSNNSITEYNESNNQKNKTININSWQDFYGNITAEKLISNYQFQNLTVWLNQSNLNGNVFIVDKESNIDWTSLEAIGKTSSGGESSNDFSEMDSVLGMSDYEDSLYNEFTVDGTPKKTKDFILYQRNITEVPVINTTKDTFYTGILWDYSDDSGNNEYDSDDKEDLVFVSELNQSKTGKYGTYDYEITMPAKLREYNQSESSEVYLYYDLK